MGERKEGNHADLLELRISVVYTVHGLLGPGVAVMGDHDGLGHASSTASVDQGTAVARADLFHAFLEVLGLNSNAFEHELFPVVKDSFVLGRDFEVWVVVEDDVLEISFLQQSHVLLGVLEVLSNDDFAL